MKRIVIIAGEASGDLLGGGLIAALRARYPDLEVVAMAGPSMRQAGCHTLADIDELAVMGLAEVLRHYPRLRRLRQRLIADILARRPDVLIGIDVPDFTLEIERQAKLAGIPTVHYVCPQVWAWRADRLPGIRRAVDLMLALFPFEVPFLAAHGIESEFVGHPLADRIPLEIDRAAARARLLPGDLPGPIIALMPGSRRQELARHVDLFLLSAAGLRQRIPDARFVIGAVNEAAATYIESRRMSIAPDLAATVLLRQSTELLSAADVALVASGTVTLEAALCQTPGVVAYRLAPLSYWLMRHAVKVPHVALPNLLLERRLMPEYLQAAATPGALAAALLAWLDDPTGMAACRAQCAVLHASLRRDASATAARAVGALLEARRVSGG